MPEAGVPVDPAAVEEAVDDAGFELLWLDLECLGVLSNANTCGSSEAPILTVPSTGQAFVLCAEQSDGGHDGYTRICEWLDSPDQAITVRGRVLLVDGKHTALSVREFDVH